METTAIRPKKPNLTCVEHALHVLSEQPNRTFSVREMAEAVGINYERNWNKRAPRISRRLIAAGFAVQTMAAKRVRLGLDPRWLGMTSDEILRAFAAADAGVQQ